MKKSPSQYSNYKKPKNTLSNHHQLHQNHTNSFYSSLTSMGTNGSHYQTAKNRQTTKNSPMPFLPPVSGASAFSNYSTNAGHSSSIVSKVKTYFFIKWKKRAVPKIASESEIAKSLERCENFKSMLRE